MLNLEATIHQCLAAQLKKISSDLANFSAWGCARRIASLLYVWGAFADTFSKPYYWIIWKYDSTNATHHSAFKTQGVLHPGTVSRKLIPPFTFASRRAMQTLRLVGGVFVWRLVYNPFLNTLPRFNLHNYSIRLAWPGKCDACKYAY